VRSAGHGQSSSHGSHADRGRVALAQVVGTRLFDAERAAQYSGWARELAGIHTPETVEFGISSFVYRARRPFHPEQLKALFASEWSGVIRSKGFFWIASKPSSVGTWSQAGGMCSVEQAGYWWVSVTKTAWPTEPEALEDIVREWQEPWGDRRQEIVMIGADMDEPGLHAAFDACLLSEAELIGGLDAWAELPGSYVPWEADSTSDERRVPTTHGSRLQ
jgi:G3E family GTPase